MTEILKSFRNLSMILAKTSQRTLKTKINEDNLDEATYKYFYDWYKSIVNKKYDRSKKLCINFIEFCKNTLKLNSWGELNTNYNKVLISAILFRGL